MKIKLIFFLLSGLLAIVHTGCSGRIDDRVDQAKIDFQAHKLQPGRATLIVFGALWCKPCREEISSLNKVQNTFSDQIQIRQYIVEGAVEGQAPEENDLQNFYSKNLERPVYELRLDKGWNFFGSVKPPTRALPLIVFISPDGSIQSMVQRSLDYETELRPGIERLLAGLPPTVEPDPLPNVRVLSFADWVNLSPLHQPEQPLQQNLRASWLRGLDKFAFDVATMPFEMGQISEQLKPDARSYRLISVLWKTTSCQLVVYVNESGIYANSQGVCW